MKKRCLHLCTSLTFKLDLSEALSQCRQMVVAYAGLAFSPRGVGSEKLVALRHRSVSCFPLLLSNSECSTWGLQLCPGISVWKETQCVTRAYCSSFFWLYEKPLQQGVGIPSTRAKGRSWRPIINHCSPKLFSCVSSYTHTGCLQRQTHIWVVHRREIHVFSLQLRSIFSITVFMYSGDKVPNTNGYDKLTHFVHYRRRNVLKINVRSDSITIECALWRSI